MASPSTINREWYVVDATGHTLGRLASEIAKILRGKNKPIYTPHIDTGDYVVVINADKIKVTGKKMDQKIYYNHSGYVGGMKETTLKEKMAKKTRRCYLPCSKRYASKRSFRKIYDQETSRLRWSGTQTAGSAAKRIGNQILIKGGHYSGYNKILRNW